MLLLASGWLVGIRAEIRKGTLSKARLEYWRWNRDDWSQGVPKSTSRVFCSVWLGGRQEGAYHSPSPRYRFCAGQTVPGLGLGAWARAKLGHQTGLGVFPTHSKILADMGSPWDTHKHTHTHTHTNMHKHTSWQRSPRYNTHRSTGEESLEKWGWGASLLEAAAARFCRCLCVWHSGR